MTAIKGGFAPQDLQQDKYRRTGRTTRLCDDFIQKYFRMSEKRFKYMTIM